MGKLIGKEEKIDDASTRGRKKRINEIALLADVKSGQKLPPTLPGEKNNA